MKHGKWLRENKLELSIAYNFHAHQKWAAQLRHLVFNETRKTTIVGVGKDADEAIENAIKTWKSICG